MESEIEKLRKEREEEIKRNNEAALYRQEEAASKAVPSLFAIIGFLKGCSDYIKGIDGPGHIGDKGKYFYTLLFFQFWEQ